MPARKSTAPKPEKNKSLEQWIWDAACGSGGLPIKNKIAAKEWGHSCPHLAKNIGDRNVSVPLRLFGQDQRMWGLHLRRAQRTRKVGQRRKLPNQYVADTWARIRKNKVFLVNASQIFEKGNPKNFIPDDGIQRIADILIGWQEEEKLSRIVDHAELKKNDYNISPSRYIHTSDAETYRPIAEIVTELDAIEAEAKETDKALRKILKQLGV
jgi:type I restriction-modification system DNA methylase subunit